MTTHQIENLDPDVRLQAAMIADAVESARIAKAEGWLDGKKPVPVEPRPGFKTNDIRRDIEFLKDDKLLRWLTNHQCDSSTVRRVLDL